MKSVIKTNWVEREKKKIQLMDVSPERNESIDNVKKCNWNPKKSPIITAC